MGERHACCRLAAQPSAPITREAAARDSSQFLAIRMKASDRATQRAAGKQGMQAHSFGRAIFGGSPSGTRLTHAERAQDRTALMSASGTRDRAICTKTFHLSLSVMYSSWFLYSFARPLMTLGGSRWQTDLKRTRAGKAPSI